MLKWVIALFGVFALAGVGIYILAEATPLFGPNGLGPRLTGMAALAFVVLYVIGGAALEMFVGAPMISKRPNQNSKKASP